MKQSWEQILTEYRSSFMEVEKRGYPYDPGYGMDHRTGNAAGHDITHNMVTMTNGVDTIRVGYNTICQMTYVEKGERYWAIESIFDFKPFGYAVPVAA